MSYRYEAKTDAELERIGATLLSLFPKRQHGLTPIGVLGVLVRARRVGLLPAIGPVRAKSNRAEFPLELVASFRHLPSA